MTRELRGFQFSEWEAGAEGLGYLYLNQVPNQHERELVGYDTPWQNGLAADTYDILQGPYDEGEAEKRKSAGRPPSG